MVDWKMDLSADAQVRVEKRIERVADDPLRGVLNGDDAVVRLPFFHFAKDGGDTLKREQLDAMAEPGQGCGVCMTAGRAPVGNGERPLQGPAAGDDFTVDRPKRRVRQRPFIRGGQPVEDLLLA